MEISLASFKARFTYDPQKDLLGKGGYSEVYKAYDNDYKTDVALKIYQGDYSSQYNLLNEIRKYRRLQHPHVIQHLEAFEVNTGSQDLHGNTIKYQVGILEYANAGTLADLIKQGQLKGSANAAKLESIAKDIISGLEYLHSQNVIHRDLKPSNILLFKQGEKLVPKICDFGIAKVMDNATAVSTQLVGTVEYMAPEYFRTDLGDIGKASDLWSLGVILYEAATGQHPFGKASEGYSNGQIINNIIQAKLYSLDDISNTYVKNIIINCLQPKIENRKIDIQKFSSHNNINLSEEKIKVVTNSTSKTIINGQKKRSVITRNIVVGISIVSLVMVGLLLSQRYRTEKRILIPAYTSTGYCGFKDFETGEIIIPLTFDYVDSFHEGRAKIMIEGKFGFIDKTGKVVIPAIYYDANAFSDGMAAIGIRKGNDVIWGYVDENGNETIKPQYTRADKFKNGLATVSLEEYKKEGIINKNNFEIIPLQYSFAEVHKKMIYLRRDGRYGKSALYSLDGKEIIPFNKYDYIEWFIDGLAIVGIHTTEDTTTQGWINEKGIEVIPCKYDIISDFFEGIAVVALGKKYFFIDKKGKATPLKYDYVREFADGLAAVGNIISDTSENFGFLGYIDKTGKEIIPLKYENGRDFEKGIAPVKLNGKWGCINQKGEQIIDFNYDNMWGLQSSKTTYSFNYDAWNHLTVRINDKFGILNKKGKVVFPCIYDNICNKDEYGMILAKKDGYWGVMDTLGNTIIPFKYELDYVKGGWSRYGLYCLGINGRYCVMDYNGNKILDYIDDGWCDIVRDNQIVKVVHSINEDRGESLYWVNRKGKIIKDFRE